MILAVCRRTPFSSRKRGSDPFVFSGNHRLSDKLLAYGEDVVKFDRRRLRLTAYCACVLILTFLTACQSATTPTPTREPSATPGATPTFRIYAARTPTPRTIETINKIVESNPSFLASQHLGNGLQCQSCHSSFPPAGAPKTNVCLACHGGSYTQVAALTQTGMNPHQSHLGEIACVFCHYGHQPFDSQCSKCKHQTKGGSIQLPGHDD